MGIYPTHINPYTLPEHTMINLKTTRIATLVAAMALALASGTTLAKGGDSGKGRGGDGAGSSSSSSGGSGQGQGQGRGRGRGGDSDSGSSSSSSSSSTSSSDSGRHGRGADDGRNHHVDGNISGRDRSRGAEDNGVDAPDDSDGRVRASR